MTKRQREQVVELLRCAADNAITRRVEVALGDAALDLDRLSIGGRHWTEFLGALYDTKAGVVCGSGYEFCLLELAQRVEEGSWP